MIRRIRLHNYLNGLWFSLLEYLFVAAILTPFLIFYVLHERTLYALAAAGVIFNCLTVCSLAVASIWKREHSIGLLRFSRDRELRRRIGIDHPYLAHDTLVLSVTVLIPYWMFAALLLDAATSAGKR
jgi:hypothetical protein